MDLLTSIVLGLPPILLAITLHEAAHGYVARHFGDSTAWMLGRVTLNPIKHIDPIGTILVPLGILLISGGGFLFGWAKPVPVNFGNLRHPKQDMIWVAAAGPAVNLLMAFAWALVFGLASPGGIYPSGALQIMSATGVSINIALMVLNLLPILPLDGGRILAGLLPVSMAIPYSRTERFGFFVVILLLVTGVLGIVLGPLMNLAIALVETVTGVNLPGGL